MRCVSAVADYQCDHREGHTGTHYSLRHDERGTPRSRKWSSDEATHIALGDGELIPVQTATDVMRAHRMRLVAIQNYAALAGISYEAAERAVNEELARENK